MVNGARKSLEEGNSSAPPAFILGVSANGLSFIRSLGRKGIPVVALDSIPFPGAYSKYCKKIILPEILENEEKWLEFLIVAGKGLPRKGVIIPTGDAHVLFLSRNRDKLSPYFDFSLVEEKLLEAITNKKTQYELARKHRIAAPKSYFPKNLRQAISLAPTLDYPCILKPYYSHLWKKFAENKKEYSRKKLVEVSGLEELVEVYSEMIKGEVGIMIQERIPGGDERLYGFFTYFGKDSEPLAVFTKRKLRQTWGGYGVACFQVSLWEPTVAELGIRLLRSVKYQGLANIEFKKDPRDGQFKLIEVNPRSALSGETAVASGVDIPYIAYRDIIGEKVQKNPSFSEGVKWVDLVEDFKASLLNGCEKKLTFAEWAKSLRGRRSYAIWSADDSLPFIVQSIQIFRLVPRKIFYWLKRGRPV